MKIEFLNNIILNIKHSIEDSHLYTELKNQYTNADAKTRRIVNFSALGIFAFTLFFMLLYFVTNIYSKKTSLENMKVSIDYLNDANNKIKTSNRFKTNTSSNAINTDTPLTDVIKRGLQQNKMESKDYKIKEDANNLVVNLTRISIKQIVGMMHFLENSPKNISIHSLEIDSQNNKAGYLWSTIKIKKNK